MWTKTNVVENKVLSAGRVSRREAVAALAGGCGWLAWSALSQAATGDGPLVERAPHFTPRAKRVIWLCMRGGPSHLDLFDHKPELQKRSGQSASLGRDSSGAILLGAVRPLVQQGASGLWMSPLMPHLARHADDLCVIRSMQTDLPNHAQAFGQMHTGSFQFVRPSLGAWSLYGLGSENQNLPGFITLNPPADFGGARNYGSAFLPAVCQGTKLGSSQLPDLYAALLGRDDEPGPPMKYLSHEKLTSAEQQAQLALIRRLDERKLERDRQHPEIEGAIRSFELAYRMQDEVPQVLDIRREPAHVLRLYGIEPGAGRDQFARQCLLARRLVEAGVRFVEVTSSVHWDHHYLLRDSLAKSCLATDQPVAALLTDLKQRGLLDDTLVIWAGEFGRTPYAQNGDGRDHNHKGYSVWMAGGGVRGGLAFGETDELGYQAAVNPVHIHDWHATILHLLGLDHKRLTFDFGGRPFRLTNVSGHVVHEILS